MPRPYHTPKSERDERLGALAEDEQTPNPTAAEDAVLDAFNASIGTLNLRKLGRNAAAAQMPELGLVTFPGLDASITIDEQGTESRTIGGTRRTASFEATIGPDAEVVYSGALPGSAVAAILARFVTELALAAIEDAGHARAMSEPIWASLHSDWRCPTCRVPRMGATVNAFGVVTCPNGHESL